jgi:predicted phosphatase
MSDLTNKDAEQDTKIAVMDSTLENSIRRIEMVHKRVDDTNEELEKLRDRIRTLEKWVAGAGAVIAAATFIIGIVASADARTFEEEQNIGVLTQKIKQYEIEKNMTQPEDVIKNALKEWELWQQ